MIHVRYERGLYLPAQDLWLDPWDAKRFAFVSHAHSDHIASHDEIIVSDCIARLMQARLPRRRVEPIVPSCGSTFADGAVPVLLADSLGKGHEILCSLDAAGLTPMLHGSVYQMTQVYVQFGQSFCKYVRYSANQVAGKVLICPPSANRSRMLEKIRRKRVAMVSGWAVDPNAVYRYQVDAAFPLSDHADYDDLLRYVDLVQPKRVLPLHGFAAESARDLRDRGVEAWALSDENQLEFPSLGSGPVSGAGEGVRPSRTSFRREVETHTRDACTTQSELATFANVGEAIGATPAKLEKVRLLADYLRTLDRDRLPIATVYFTGRAFAQSDRRTLQVGGSIIYRAIMSAAKLSETEFHRIAYSHGDAGKTAFGALDGRTNPEPFALTRSRDFFDMLHKTRGPIAKTELLQSRLTGISAREGQYVVKILTGDLRIGLREGLVEEAIATAFDVAIDDVKEANMLLGDIG